MKTGKTFLLFGLATLLAGTCHATAKLQTYEDVRLVDSGANDGDSFIVEADGSRMHLRLYYVDCTETSSQQVQKSANELWREYEDNLDNIESSTVKNLISI